MVRKLWSALALLLLAVLVWRLWPRPPRVVLIGVDGGADYLLDEFLANGSLPTDGGFAEIARRGVRAEAALTVNASVTAPSFASLLTGAYPERHGLMGNTYYRVRDPIGQTRSSFDAPLAAEPLWESLRRAGKRVVQVGQDIGLATPGLGPNLTFGFGENDGASQLVELMQGDFKPVEGWQSGRPSWEQVREARLIFRTGNHGEHTAHLRALDTLADASERYDRLEIDFDSVLTNRPAAVLQPGAWAPVRLPVDSPTAIGVWVKLLELSPDLNRVRIYIGEPHFNTGRPVEFVQRVEQALSRRANGQAFWPGGPDTRALESGWIDEATWFEQVERQGNYIRDAALWVMANEPFDLLITYQPQIDEGEHQFFLRDPRQSDYADEALRRRAAEAIARVWRSVDANLNEVTRAAGRNTNIVVVADHGMSPVHTRVYPNRLLAASGFRVGGPEAEVRLLTSSGQVHVYMNLAGRQPGGVVEARRYAPVVERLVGLFARVRDPQTGEPVFEVVARREETRPYGLLHEETTGDVWLAVKPGYGVSGDAGPGDVLVPARLGGAHGYLASGRQMQTIFLAAGPGVRKTQLGVVNNIDVAPTITRLLGVSPPRDAQGRVLEEIVVKKE